MARNILHVALVLVVALCHSMISRAAAEETPMAPGHHERTFASTQDGSEQPYRLYIPPEKKGDGDWPLLVVLHGRGVDQNAWFDYTPVAGAADAHGYVVAAPFARGNYWYRGPAEQDVLDIVDDVKRLVAVDAARVYLIGHSMGGWGTFWISLRHPDVFAATAPMSGWAPSELLINAHHTPPFVLHDATDPIVPVTNSRGAVAQLGVLGVSHRYREEHGYGHASSMIGDNFERIFAWLGEHRLDPAPARVHFATRTPHVGAAFWVRVLDTVDFPRAASIQANASDAEGIDIATERVSRLAIDLARVPLVADSPTVTIDGAIFELPHRGGWAVFHRESGGDWHCEGILAAPPAPSASPVVELPWKQHLTDADAPAFVTAWGNLVREQAGADLALFTRDMFRDAGWPVTIDRLIDTWVYPVEQLVRFRLSGAQIATVLEADADRVLVKPDGMGELDPSADYELIAPANLGARVAGRLEQLPLTVPEYLVRAVAAE